VGLTAVPESEYGRLEEEDHLPVERHRNLSIREEVSNSSKISLLCTSQSYLVAAAPRTQNILYLPCVQRHHQSAENARSLTNPKMPVLEAREVCAVRIPFVYGTWYQRYLVPYCYWYRY
jgi:hypothetical protein